MVSISLSVRFLAKNQSYIAQEEGRNDYRIPTRNLCLDLSLLLLNQELRMEEPGQITIL